MKFSTTIIRVLVALSLLLQIGNVVHAQPGASSRAGIAKFETTTSILHIPVLDIAGSRHWADLKLDSDGLLSLLGFGSATATSSVPAWYYVARGQFVHVEVPQIAIYTQGVRQNTSESFRASLVLTSQIPVMRFSISFLQQEKSFTELVSISGLRNPTQSNGSDTGSSAISGDGQFIAFASNVTNWWPQHREKSIYVYSSQHQATSLASTSSQVYANGASHSPSISTDGRYLAYASEADNLVSNDTNFATDIFWRDLVDDRLRRVSVHSNGSQSRFAHYAPFISGNGRFVSFATDSPNLVDFDTNGLEDIFVHDTQTGRTSRVSVSSNGEQAASGGLADSRSRGTSALSHDGRYVAFESASPNLVSGDTNRDVDVFVHDRQTGRTTRVSVSSIGTQGISHSSAPSISADGRFVSFLSLAPNLVSNDRNSEEDVFLHDTLTGVTARISISTNGQESNGRSYRPRISADGRFVTYASDASNLVAGDTNNQRDVFLYDRERLTTTRVSATASAQGNGASYDPAVSADGRYVTFSSNANNHTSVDVNNAPDVFIKKMD